MALKGRADDQSKAAAQAIESLIARNALALRIAANGALGSGAGAACDRTQRALSIAPAIAQSFELESLDGKALCVAGTVGDTGSLPLVAPGNIRVRIAPGQDAVAIRVGTATGMATAVVPLAEIRNAALDAPGDVLSLVLHDDTRELRVFGPPPGPDLRLRLTERQIGSGTLFARVGAADKRITTGDRLLLLLPVLMWIAAALVTWLLVSRLLIRPLKRLERSVRSYQPGQGPLELPQKLGPAMEIRQLREAFARAIDSGRRLGAGNDRSARRAAQARPRSPSPGKEQSAGRRLAAQHPRPRRGKPRRARRLCRDQPPGRRALDRSPQPFRRDGRESRDRAPSAARRARRRTPRGSARTPLAAS